MPTSDIKKGPLYVDSTNNRVGIGTSSPSVALQVKGASIPIVSQSTSTGTGPNFLKFIDSASTDLGYVGYGASNNNLYLVNYSADPIIFYNSSEKMRIDASGRVGIGTTSPTGNANGSALVLEVHSSGANPPEILAGGQNAEISIAGGSAASYLWSTGAYPLVIGTNGSEKMRITSAGDVAMLNHASIGVNAPASTRALTVAGATDGSGSSILVCYNSSLASKFAVRDDGYITATGDIQVGGGVLLGGTGSANYLDDYEEGTWVPQLYKGTTQVTSPTVASGKYRKVGDLLYLNWYFYKSSGALGSQTGNWIVKGFPFALSTGSPYAGIPVTYFGINSVDYFGASPHRVQANYSDGMEVYGAQTNTNWTSGYVELAANGVIRLS